MSASNQPPKTPMCNPAPVRPRLTDLISFELWHAEKEHHTASHGFLLKSNDRASSALYVLLVLGPCHSKLFSPPSSNRYTPVTISVLALAEDLKISHLNYLSKYSTSRAPTEDVLAARFPSSRSISARPPYPRGSSPSLSRSQGTRVRSTNSLRASGLRSYGPAYNARRVRAFITCACG